MPVLKYLAMKLEKRKTLLLSGRDVQQIVSRIGVNTLMDCLIERLERAIHDFDFKETSIPIRSGFSYNAPEAGLIEWMPLHHVGEKVMIKVVGYHPLNPANSSIPTILSTISAYETDTGHLAALMDGVLATALRTGAASAVATSHMAHPESKILGLIGCGVQGVTQLQAISRVMEIDEVLVFDVDPAALYSFERRCRSFDTKADIRISDIGEIARNADIISTATSIDIGAGPLFDESETKPHLHINAVGSDFPGKVEIPLQLLKRCTVIPDFGKQAVIEGECQQLTPDQIGPELHEIVQNAGEYTDLKTGLTVFDSTGWALEDSVVMELLIEHAKDLGIYEELEVESIPEDSKNPYEFLDIKVESEETDSTLLSITN
jgi:ornithine cyclodeaminase/alanine dehydrogenase-like protein (mu-crystallin family)